MDDAETRPLLGNGFENPDGGRGISAIERNARLTDTRKSNELRLIASGWP